MWMKITPKNTNNNPVSGDQELHINALQIGTVLFGAERKTAQVRLADGLSIETEVPEEVALLWRLVHAESLQYKEALAERLPGIMLRAARDTIAQCAEEVAEDNALEKLKL